MNQTSSKAHLEQTLTFSGTTARLLEEPVGSDHWLLMINNEMHSMVDVSNPSNLLFDYAKKVGKIIEHLFPEKSKINVLHLGGGALTFARYINSTRPGSSQWVIEIEENLIDFVLQAIPMSTKGPTKIHLGDARSVLEEIKQDLYGKIDLVISEVFLGPHSAANVSSVEFYRLVAFVLSKNGVLVTNIIDDGLHRYVKDQAVTSKNAFLHTSALVYRKIDDNKYRNCLMVSSNRQQAHEISKSSVFEKNGIAGEVIEGLDLEKFSVGGRLIEDNSAYSWPPGERKNDETD